MTAEETRLPADIDAQPVVQQEYGRKAQRLPPNCRPLRLYAVKAQSAEYASLFRPCTFRLFGGVGAG